MIEAVVTINGTDVNPWHKMGLTRNPFPQHGKYELAAFDRLLADLDADPIPNEDELMRRLEGSSSEFVMACVANFVPGKRTRFKITFPGELDEEVE